MKLLLALAFCLAAAAATACGNAALVPSPTLTHARTPAPGPPVGPIVLISVVPTVAPSPPGGSGQRVIVAYYAGARREYRRLTLPPDAVTPVFRSAVGDVLYVSGADGAKQLHAWSPVTGGDNTLPVPKTSPLFGPDASGLTVSPDGRSAAFTIIRPHDSTVLPGSPTTTADVALVNLTTGAERVLFHSDDVEHSALHGYPYILVWRDDGQALLVEGARGGPPGTWATLLLDGTLIPSITGYAVAAPSGRALYTDDFNEVGCILQRSQRLRIWDAATGAVTAEVDDPGRGIVARAWSPSGDALLYEQFRTTTPPNNDGCVAAYDASSGAWYLLGVSGGPPQPAGDVAALRRSWDHGLTITYGCPTNDPPRVFDDCSREPTAISVDGRSVASGSSVTLLGIADLPPR